MNTPPLLLRLLFFLLFGSLSLQAQLDSLPENPWLGHFVGWENRKCDITLGADGKLLFMLKKSGERSLSRQIKVSYFVEEKIDGKWISRKFKRQNLSSESAPVLNPSEPIAFQAMVNGETKVEFTQLMSNDFLMIKAKLIEKKTDNPIRLGLTLNFPRSTKKIDEKDKREIRKLFRSDQIQAIRKNDGKKVKANYHEDVDFSGENYLQEGASQIQIKSDYLGGEFTAKIGNDKNGVLQLTSPEKLYNGNFKITWHPEMSQLGDPDCYLNLGFK